MKAVALALAGLALLAFAHASMPPTQHTFSLGKEEFLLDGKPFRIQSGEMHPARIPAPYWRHRIRMAKAMGLNTIAVYVFWNYYETSEGKFDFTSEGHDLGKFLKICQQEGMWVLLRPGPYCCGEWDFGGIPTYLLKVPDLKVRCMDPRYIHAVDRYLTKLSAVVAPYQVSHGGPILMVQLENEYGSYGNDRTYIAWLHDFWRSHGIDVPFYTADGATDFMLEAGSYPGAAVGLDSGSSLGDWEVAHRNRPGVPVFSSETYPGWLTHWGEAFATNSTESILGELHFLNEHRKSYNLYVVHGGTNFGFTAGANSGGKGYEPDITSYDYDAPITEQGRPTPKYMAMREAIAEGSPLPPVPDPIPTVKLDLIPMKRWTSIWDHLPAPLHSAQPQTFEAMGQDQGLVLYRTKLIGHKTGTLTVTHLHDFALVYVDGNYVGVLDRRAGIESIALPKATSATPTLDLLVEGMGHINYGQDMIDRKGITDRVTLDGMTLMNWESFLLPLDSAWLAGLRAAEGRFGGTPKIPSAGRRKYGAEDTATFFRGTFDLANPADTFLNLASYKKGYVWVNGHCLGRYWEIGPQKNLYCPGTWLKKGQNEVVVLDLLQETPASLGSSETLR